MRREQDKGVAKKKIVVLGSGWGAHALVSEGAVAILRHTDFQHCLIARGGFGI